ncbi:MAG: CPBP family intramembrane glutamic endopeptidase [Gaiellaceae bacterium]
MSGNDTVSTYGDSSTPGRTAAWIWLGFTGVLTLIAFGLPSPEEDAEPLVYSYEFTANAIFIDAVFVIAAVVIAYFYTSRDWQDTFGFRRFTGRHLGLAAGVAIASLVVGAVVEIFLNAGDRQGIAADTWDSSRLTPFIINAAIIIGLGPFVEELLFRGVGVRVLSVFGAPAAIAMSGVMFGLIHGIWEALPALIVFGVGLAYVRPRTNSVFPAFLAHAAFNAVGLAASFAG